MSIPKSVNRTVKRRGLAIATAVAVAGSGIVGANYASAQDANGEIAAVEENANQTPTAQSVFDREKETIDTRLTETKNPLEVAQEVAGKYENQFSGDETAFGQFQYQLEQKVKRYFTERVQKNEIELGEQYTLPTAEEAFENEKEAKIKPRLIESKNPEQVGKEIATQYVAGFDSDTEYGKFEFQIVKQTKEYFNALVDSGEIQLGAEYTTPSAKDYFKSREEAITADLISPEGLSRLSVDEVVNKHADLLDNQAGSKFRDEKSKTAWKDSFRLLVEVKEARIVLSQQTAKLKQQREELVAAAKELLPQIEELDQLNNDLQKQAENQNARESELDDREAALKQQREELAAELRELLPEIEKLEKLHEDLTQKEQDQDARDSELDAKAAELKKQQAEFVEQLKELQPEIEKLEKLHEDLEQKAKDQDARDSELDAKAAELKKQQAEFAEELKQLLPEIEKLDKLNDDLQKQADEQAARQAELDKKEADLNDKASALDEREASVNQQREQLDAAAKGLLPRIDELDKLNNDLQKQADEQAARQAELDQKESELAGRDAELDAKTAELRKQQAEFVEKMKQLQPDIEKLNKLNNELEQKAQDQNAKESELKELAEKLQKQEEALVAKSKELQPQLDKLQKLNNELEQKAQAQSAKESELNAHEAKLKQQRDELTAKAGKLASDLQRLEQLKKELDKSNQDNGGNKEQPKPSLPGGSSDLSNPNGVADAFKGFFGLAAGLSVFALIFGGILQPIKHFDGFGAIHEQVRDAFAKIGIRF